MIIFIVTPPKSIATFHKNDARKKLSDCVKAPSSAGDSHLILTYHPRGNKRNMNSVHFLSFPKDHTFGPIPIENSCTVTHAFLARIKCPNS